MKHIEINDWSGGALIDSGSDKTLVRQTLLATMGPLEECHVILNGFGGAQYICTQRKKIKIKIDDVCHEIDALAVKDDYLDTDVLLGRDAICQENTRVVIENDKCWVENVKSATALVPELQANDRQKLMKLIDSNRGCFAENVHELGVCSIKKLEIKLTTDAPICVKPYRIAFAKREEARNIIDELLRAGIIEYSDSAYASPVVMVPKKDGSMRMCVDYRLLNRITKRTPFPMPIMEEHFAMLAGNRYFSTMDLRMGYHQVEIQEESRKYTAFVTIDGHYQYTRMPFGLVNAPAVFQNIMNVVASKFEPGEVLTYLDDMVVPSKTVDEGIRLLGKVFRVLQEAGLKLRLDKCKLLATEISYLGHTITAAGITPGHIKVNAIEKFNAPTDVTEVRRFLGLTGFFRKFIPNYAVISQPLTKLLHKEEVNTFNWGEEQANSFQRLVKLLCDKPVLALYNFHAHHEVHTDASSVGLAGMLLQSDDLKNWNAVFYYSRHCTAAEKHYHGYELEVLAVVETLTRFRVYLLGKPFKLVTDCSAIAKARTQKELMPKIARWFMKLNEFDCEIVHRPHTKLAHVDAMSRAPVETWCDVETAGFVWSVSIGNDDWLLTMQLQDKKLSNIIDILKGEVISDQIKQLKTEYKLEKSRLYRQIDGLKFVVPKAVRWRIVRLCHDDVGHFSTDKTIARIKKHFWFDRMRKYVKGYISSCPECCYNKVSGGKKEGQMYNAVVEPIPFSTLHIDHLGPFVKSARGMCYVLALSDAFSKYLVVKAVRNTKTLPVINALNDVTAFLGLPKRIISDRGTAFTSKIFEDYCDRNNIQHVKTAVRTPRANGQVERANQSILNFLRTTTNTAKGWDLQLRDLQWSINSQQNNTSGYSPNELVFDFTLLYVVQNRILAAVQDDEENDHGIPILQKRQLAVQNINKERERWKERFDVKHKTPTKYGAGDLVVIANEPTSIGESRKLEPRYRGPYQIEKALSNDRYVITDIPGIHISQKPFNSIYACDKIKPWCKNWPAFDEDDLSNDDSSFEDES